MKDLEFLNVVIDEISHGEHSLVTDPNMDPVTLIHGDGGTGLEADTTLGLWKEYKKLLGKENLALHLVD